MASRSPSWCRLIPAPEAFFEPLPDEELERWG
jgi:hypothetical protein